MDESDATRAPTAVDDVRAVRASICNGSFEGLSDHLRRVREEFESRKGCFADLPRARPADVQAVIDAAETDEPLLEEIRTLRDGLSVADYQPQE